jgi:serine/threonine-protein kinase RsbW
MPSRLESLDQAGEVVGRLSEAAGFDEDARLDIQLAVHEALINAIVHGNRRDEARLVRLEIALDHDGLDIRVRDEGQGFDAACVPDPLVLENLCRSSGRGILLMRALMDAVAFRRPASGGTEVTMRKRLGRELERRRQPNVAGAERV